jgi:hypothetical protein
MLTTDGDAWRKRVIVDFSSLNNSPRGLTARGAARGSKSEALRTQEALKKNKPAALNATAKIRQNQAERCLELRWLSNIEVFLFVV